MKTTLKFYITKSFQLYDDRRMIGEFTSDREAARHAIAMADRQGLGYDIQSGVSDAVMQLSNDEPCYAD